MLSERRESLPGRHSIDQIAGPLYGATTTSSVIADYVRFQEAAKLISTADMRREADVHVRESKSAPGPDADVQAGFTGSARRAWGR